MNGRDFLDSNVLVYAYDMASPEKQRIARQLVRRAVVGEFVVSTQVIAEFASTLLHKLQPPVSFEKVMEALDGLGPIAMILPDAEMVRRAVEARARYGIHFYDSMIVAAAERAGCDKVWSEDLNPAQKYFGISTANPFA